MRLPRSILIGLAAALSTFVLAICASVALSIGIAEWQARQPGSGRLLPAAQNVVPARPMLLAAFAGFAVAFAWDRRRVD